MIYIPGFTAQGVRLNWAGPDKFLTSKMVSDRSGNGRHAQVFGTVDRVNGISGDQAIFFTGDSYSVAQSNPLAGRRAATISLWFKE